ncbi:MAG: hypothetical protein AAF993_22085, partial [Pseudomonadota bacterium]
KAFGVQNPDTQELALHAVYALDENGKIFYRKVARRRPVSAELIDAVDAYQGTYPMDDEAAPRKRIMVAYPQNDFQALLEITRVNGLPTVIDANAFAAVLRLRQQGRSDDAIFAYKRLVEQSINNHGVNTDALYASASWLIRSAFYSPPEFSDSANLIELGRDLQRRLERVSELEQLEMDSRGSAEHDQWLHTLARARAGLTRVRADIRSRAGDWNLRYAKASLRGYREVVGAAVTAAR